MTTKKQETFYKLARPDGFDFYTGKTINYREFVGKTVKRPGFKHNSVLCSSGVIHASRNANDCFVGAKIPCSAYLVSGVPLIEDNQKCGFSKLRILKEISPEKLFKWDYLTAINPVNPLKIDPPKIADIHKILLSSWASVQASVVSSVFESVWASVGPSVFENVWASVAASVADEYSIWDSVGARVWASVGAYVGKMFDMVVPDWKYIKYTPGKYPFQSAVDLWNMGLIPNVDGKIWRLHGGKNAEILYERR